MHPRNRQLVQRNAAWFEGEERPLKEPDMKRSIYLYSASAIAGALFSLDDDGVAAKLKEGWYESPADVPGNQQKATAPAVAVCPHCGKALDGSKAPVTPALPEGGTVTDGPLLAAFKAGKQIKKADLKALGSELGLDLADELTVKQMTEEIQAVIDTPPLGGE